LHFFLEQKVLIDAAVHSEHVQVNRFNIKPDLEMEKMRGKWNINFIG
jgi:hypothetical protein